MEVCLSGQLTEHVRDHAEEGSGQGKGHVITQLQLMVGGTVLAFLQKPRHVGLPLAKVFKDSIWCIFVNITAIIISN